MSLKIKLMPLVPIWQDPDLGIFLEQGKVFDCAGITDYRSIREALDKQLIEIVEGKLPIETSEEGLTAEEVQQMIDTSVDNIQHPKCNITTEEKADIIKRIDALEKKSSGGGSGGGTTDPVNPPEPSEPSKPDDTNKFGKYVWREVYSPVNMRSKLDITGSKMIEDWKKLGEGLADDADNTFWDEFEKCKYVLYGPRLRLVNGEPSTEANDLADTYIPIDGIGPQTQGADLVKLSKSLEGINWMWDGDGKTYITLNFTPTTDVVFYLIKRFE
jgi:hypothetical protein